MPEYRFHGGCSGCDNPIRMCPKCQYMEANWKLPDLNPENNRKPTAEELAQREKSEREHEIMMAEYERERSHMIGVARQAMSDYKRGVIQ